VGWLVRKRKKVERREENRGNLDDREIDSERQGDRKRETETESQTEGETDRLRCPEVYD